MVGKGKDAAVAPPKAAPVPRNAALLRALEARPPRPTPAERLRAALHLSVSAAASLAVAAAIFIAATLTQPQPVKGAMQNGCALAATTIAVIAMPELGHSVRKGIQRIIGVMIGGWLFCGLYLAHQSWWYLGLLLGAFTFISVASSHWIVGREAMYPPMVVAAFVVCVGFDSPQKAVDGTVAKTVGIGGAILVYTVLSSILFPRTATQQAVDSLGLVLQELRDMADGLLRGRKAGATATAELDPAAEAGATSGAGVVTEAAGVPTGRHAPGSGGRALPSATTLAATIPYRLRIIQSLLPATSKERFLGKLPGGCMCYMPAPAGPTNTSFRADTLAVVHVAHLVHRALWLMIRPDDDAAAGNGATGAGAGGGLSVLDRALPQGLDPSARDILADMGDAAVAALDEMSTALPPSGGPRAVSVGVGGHVERYAALCERLYGLSLGLGGHHAPAAQGGQQAQQRGAGGGGVGGARGRWQAAISSVMEVNAAKRGGSDGSTALARLVGGMLQRGDIDDARWASTLLLLQQLGVCLYRLQDCLGILLPVLPGAPRIAANHAPAGISVEAA